MIIIIIIIINKERTRSRGRRRYGQHYKGKQREEERGKKMGRRSPALAPISSSDLLMIPFGMIINIKIII